MRNRPVATESSSPTGDRRLRDTLLSGIPVTERKLTLAAIDTPVLVGGDGPPVVLLHGPAANALHWRWMIPGLVRRYGVVVPDLPGHGDSTVTGILDAERVFLWLAELIEHTCPAPPTLVGSAVGGAIAARFAARFGDRIRQLVLVDTMGFAAFDPAPAFGTALQAFLARPTEATHDELWRYCAYDFHALQARTGRATWKAFSGYNLDRVTDPAVMSAVEQVMAVFGLPAITPAELARIRVPTTVIWGRYDLATPLIVAEVVAARYGWSLEVIENCADDPPVEQPETLLAALLPLLGEAIRT